MSSNSLRALHFEHGMVGHGRPREGPGAIASHCELKLNCRTRLSRVVWCCSALIGCAAILLCADLQADELDLCLRLTWGGGEARPWRGTVVARDGQLLAPRCLGSEADVPDEFFVERDTLRFAQPIPVRSDGFDVQVIGTDETMLVLEFVPADKPEAKKTIEVALKDFLQSTRFAHDEPIDDRRNSLHIQRAPGDRIRVEFERPSLVFAPNEEFLFTVQPHEVGLPNATVMHCTLQLMPVDSDDVLWKESHDVRVDAAGNTPAIGPIKLALPPDDGVYDIVISLTQRRFAENLVPSTLVPAKPLMQRRVQVIVLEEQPQTAEPFAGGSTEWTLVEEIDVANPKWWERLNWLPQWKVLPGMKPRGPLGDRPLVSRDFLGQKINELGHNGWHAVPIPIGKLGEPHILEVEYPNDQGQTLGVSLVEPNAAGEVRTFGVDSGVDVSSRLQSLPSKLGKHRLIFWPRTQTPWLLLSNRRNDLPAVFGKIRVFAGPARLPPLELTTADGQRLLAAHYDKPLFSENFGAGESLDTATNRSYKDWQTFYLGGLRLAEYLKHVGFNAAVVTVNCDGGTIYPSRALHTTPKFDNGQLFQTGQDPLQKDVLEMLLRIFDREGLKLIPAIQFSSPLPVLEDELRLSQSDLGGIALVGFLNGDSKPKLGRADSRRGAAPLYNPLDPRVQKAMQQVAAEVLDRCAAHPCFAGLAVQLSPFAYASLPDDVWCLDDATFERFSRETQQTNPLGQDRIVQRMQLVRGSARNTWLQWRTTELTKFYRDLNMQVQQSNPGAKLVLTTTELAGGRVIQNALRPRLSPARADFADAMMRHGIDAGELTQVAQTVLLRPHRVTISPNLSVGGAQIELDQNEIVDEYFRLAGQTSGSSQNEPLPLQLPEFDKVSPFGAENTSTSFAAHIQPAAENNRHHLVHDLASLDAPLIFQGGWMLPLGQEESQTRVVRTLRELPIGPFATIKSTSVGDSSGVVVRSLKHAGRTYIYAANPTKLGATLQIDLRILTPTSTHSLDGRPPPVLAASGNSATWTVVLEPYDVGAIACMSEDVQVMDWNVQFDSDSITELGSTLQELRVRIDQLNRFQPVQMIDNPDFEQPGGPGQVAGWTIARNPGVTVNVDNNHPNQGTQSLHFRVEGNKTGWIRSRSFPIPRTGRISVQAWIRTRDAARQPPLRVSIDRKLNTGPPYYRYIPIGVDVDSRSYEPTGRPAQATLSAEWSASPILIHFADLPVANGGEITIGFDMIGSGEVWIDNVQVSDVFFVPTEWNELQKNVFNAQFQLRSGKQTKLAECQRFLEGYWPQFILEFVPPPRLAKVNPATPPVPTEKSSKWQFPKIPLKPMFNKSDKGN